VFEADAATEGGSRVTAPETTPGLTALARTAAAIAAGVLALAFAAPADAKLTSSFSNGVLTITGDDGDDQITVTCGPDALVKLNGADPPGGAIACARVVEVDAVTAAGDDTIDFAGIGTEFGRARFPGFGNRTGAAAVTGPGNDLYTGSRTAFNLFDGEEGEDRARGGAARDQLTGGPDSDRLKSGDGRDSVLGNGGADRLFGGSGADVLSGNAGPDRLVGDAGDDLLGGGTGDDRLLGGPGRDKLFGGAGRDHVNGGPGKDVEKEKPGG
jgi:Ca2+-binding RTX toxin-like protein